jgi:NAD(P)-dependent dehydrogenase (short-subunit alcohol dehydrogenase family)
VTRPPSASAASTLLAGKIVVVSGIGPGLGCEVARAVARHGADVALGARSAERLAAVAADVRALGRRVVTVSTDIAIAADCARLVAAAVDAFGRIDVLVNNAYHPGTYVPIADDDLAASWRPPFETNVLGTLQLTQAVLPVLRRQGGGAVVMVASMIVRRPLATMGGYAASKAALLVAMQTLAREVGADGIRVNAVLPGYIWGPPLEGYFAQQAAAAGVDPRALYDDVAREIALGRIPTSAEVADAVVFLASDLSRAMTGASIDVNGGHHFH